MTHESYMSRMIFKTMLFLHVYLCYIVLSYYFFHRDRILRKGDIFKTTTVHNRVLFNVVGNHTIFYKKKTSFDVLICQNLLQK